MDGTKVDTHPLISIRSSATVVDAAQLMAACSMGAVGVLGEDKMFVGIFTERDLTALVAQVHDVSRFSIGEVANDLPVVVEGPLSETDAIALMKSAHVRHLIVKERGDHRIVSMRDLITSARPFETLEAHDVMSVPGIACRDSAFFEEVVEFLAGRDISGMPVVDQAGIVVGVISERDLAHALGGPLVRLAVRRRPHGRLIEDELSEMPREARRVKDIMSSPPFVAMPDATVAELAGAMLEEGISRVPIVDDGRLVGVVTRGDLLTAMVGTLVTTPQPASSPVVIGHERERVDAGV